MIRDDSSTVKPSLRQRSFLIGKTKLLARIVSLPYQRIHNQSDILFFCDCSKPERLHHVENRIGQCRASMVQTDLVTVVQHFVENKYFLTACRSRHRQDRKSTRLNSSHPSISY